MANPWDQDEVIAPAPVAAQQPSAAAAPWEQDEVLAPAGYWDNGAALQGDGELGGDGTLEIDIIGGTPMGEAEMRAPLPAQVGEDARPMFALDSDIGEGTPLHAGHALVASVKDMFGSQRSVAEYVAEKSGGRVARTSDGGYGVILPDGREYRVNEKGLDSTDVANVAGNIAAAFLPAAWAGRVAKARNLGAAGRIGLQGAVAGGQDAAMHAGATGGVDVERAALSAVGGGLGELAGTGLSAASSKLAQIARARSGANRQSAIATLQAAGIEQPRPSLLAQLAPQMEQVRLGADPRAVLGEAEYGFQYTMGQRLTDPARKHAQLSQEEVLRQSPGGAAAFRNIEEANRSRLDEVLAGMGERLGGGGAATPGELVQGAAARLRQQADELKSQVDDAYAGVRNAGTVAIDAASVSNLPNRLRQAVADIDIHPDSTRGAHRALEQVREATAKVMASANAPGANRAAVTLRALEMQRRILNNAIGGATNPTDRRALTLIKREYDSWMDEAIDTALVRGDKAALDQLKQARALRAEFARRFEGGKDADRFITGLLDGSRTPEELMNIALGASQVSKAGGARFIARLRTAANDDPAVMGALRAAHLARLTRGANGETLTPGEIVRNIRSTEYTNASVVRALYSPGEWLEIRRLASALEPMIAKGDFARSSGSIERLMRALGVNVGGLPLVGGLLQVTKGVRDTLGAQKAVGGRLKPYNQATPMLPAVGDAYFKEKGEP